MRKLAIVKKIQENSVVEVVPMISENCVHCEEEHCIHRIRPFHVLNKKNLPIKENSVVHIGFPRIIRGIGGLASVIFPILTSFFGFLKSPEIIKNISPDFSSFGFETMRFVITLAFFLASSLILYIVTRSSIHFSRPYILKIM